MSDITQEQTELYWQARATTAEQKIKEWSVRAVAAETRIRELETQIEFLLKVRDDLVNRKTKARAILEQCGKSWRGIEPDIDNTFQKALDALEGK